MITLAHPTSIDSNFIFCLTPLRNEADLHPETNFCLKNRFDGFPHKLMQLTGFDAAEGRNRLVSAACEMARELPKKYSEHYVLWADCDSFWPELGVKVLLRTLERWPKLDLVLGAYCARHVQNFSTTSEDENGYIHVGRDTPLKPIPILRSGLHFAMHRLSLLKRLPENPFSVIYNEADNRFEEPDHSFFIRLQQIGAKAAMMPFLVGHLDGDLAFLPEQAPKRIENHELKPLPEGTIVTPSAPRSYGAGMEWMTEVNSVKQPFIAETLYYAKMKAAAATGNLMTQV